MSQGAPSVEVGIRQTTRATALPHRLLHLVAAILLRYAKYFDGFATAAEHHWGHGLGVDAGVIPHRLRYEERRPKFLVQRLDAKCDVHDVSDYRVLLAIGRSDIADDGRAGVQGDADPRREHVARRNATVKLEHDLARGGNRIRAVDAAIR